MEAATRKDTGSKCSWTFWFLVFSASLRIRAAYNQAWFLNDSRVLGLPRPSEDQASRLSDDTEMIAMETAFYRLLLSVGYTSCYCFLVLFCFFSLIHRFGVSRHRFVAPQWPRGNLTPQVNFSRWDSCINAVTLYKIIDRYTSLSYRDLFPLPLRACTCHD